MNYDRGFVESSTSESWALGCDRIILAEELSEVWEAAQSRSVPPVKPSIFEGVTGPHDAPIIYWRMAAAAIAKVRTVARNQILQKIEPDARGIIANTVVEEV